MRDFKEDRALLEELKKYSTPSVTNVVATYPENPLCLGLYNPWTQSWYTDQTVHCLFPALGRTVGYAVTCVFELPDPEFKRLTFEKDVIGALLQSPQPTILVAEQQFPPAIAGKVGLFGGGMTTMMKKAGCVGVVTNGPSRDVDEIRPLEFQYMLTGVTAGHGAFAVGAVNVAVRVADMAVCPTEIIHMDENGAVKFPANRLREVVENLRLM